MKQCLARWNQNKIISVVTIVIDSHIKKATYSHHQADKYVCICGTWQLELN